MPNLEICALHGVGLETSDLPAARERGVVIATAPVLFDDVADLAIALALACCRQIPQADRFVREGLWGPARRFQLGRKFTGMRAGIVGLGRIGIEVARRLEGFKTTIGYADPAPRDVALPALSRCARARQKQRRSVSVRGRRPQGLAADHRARSPRGARPARHVRQHLARLDRRRGSLDRRAGEQAPRRRRPRRFPR